MVQMEMYLYILDLKNVFMLKIFQELQNNNLNMFTMMSF